MVERRGTAGALQLRGPARSGRINKAGTLSIYRTGRREAILTQNARPDARPYLHPIAAPDGTGVVTEFSPEHHKHQTGLYWGFTRLNGRDYFHNPRRRLLATGLRDGHCSSRSGDEVRWQTVYDLLDEDGTRVLTETERWSMREADRHGSCSTWNGAAKRGPTSRSASTTTADCSCACRGARASDGEVVNAARQRNERAEGQRAMWIDVGMQVEGRDDLAHVAIFDHPDNAGYPQAWRVDGQLGVGAARTRAADWSIKQGETEVIRHRFVVYTGALNDVEMTNAWTELQRQPVDLFDRRAVGASRSRKGATRTFLTPEQAASRR